MRIAALETIPYALPFREPYVTARGSSTARDGPAAAANRGGHRGPRGGRAAIAARGRHAAPGRAVTGTGRQASGQAGCGGDGLGRATCRRGGRGDPRHGRATVARAGQGGGGDGLFDLAGRLSETPLWRMLRGETSAPLRCNATLAADSPHRARRRGRRLERARLRDLQAEARDRRRCRTGGGGPRRGGAGCAPTSGRQRRLEHRSGGGCAGRDRAARDRVGRAAHLDPSRDGRGRRGDGDPGRRRRERDERQGGRRRRRGRAPAVWPR